MHDLKEYPTLVLYKRFMELQTGPQTWYESRDFYCGHEDCGWNSLDAIEAELTRREVEATR